MLSYGHLQVLRTVSLNVEEGELVTLIGPNRAGKSTLSDVRVWPYETDFWHRPVPRPED